MRDQNRHIVHLDLDCFFVSVERIHNPALSGKPVAVGGSPGGRGVVASASYEARAFGVRSAMPTAQALRLCPQLIMVRGRHGEYGHYSGKIYRRMMDFAPVVERASIDELYMDLTGCELLYKNDLPGFIRRLQKLIDDEFHLPCSVSLAPTKTLAKIATDSVKPSGICVVPHGSEIQFLAPLPVSAIPGVGRKTEELLSRHQFRTIRDLQAKSAADLAGLFGATGYWLHEVANGGGSVHVHPHHDRKSVSREETFDRNIADHAQLENILLELVEDVCSTLRRKSLRGRTVSIKVRYSDFTTFTRDRSVEPTHDDRTVFSVARELLSTAAEPGRPLRLIGVRVSTLDRGEQQELPLFPSDQKREQILRAVDELRKKFGDDIIHLVQL